MLKGILKRFLATREDGRIWWHLSNYNDKPGGRQGSALVHGRATVHFAGGGEFGCEWRLGKLTTHASLRVGDGDDLVNWYIAVPGVALYFRRVREVAAPHARWPRDVPRRARDPSRGPRHGDLVDAVDEAGRVAFVVAAVAPRVAALRRRAAWQAEALHAHRLASRRVVPMPEGSYSGTCAIEEATWKRPRWFAHRILRAMVEMDNGQHIPIPGKGENAWDCDDDAIYSMSAPNVSTVSEAIGAIVTSALRDRERRAGVGWRPEKRTAEEPKP